MNAVRKVEAADAPCGRFLRMADVEIETGLSAPTIHRLHRSGQFPPKHRLSDRCVGWWESDIAAWKLSRAPTARRT